MLLSTVSSDGWINIYDLAHLVHASRSEASAGKPLGNVHKPVASYDTKGSRLTCCFLADGRKGGVVGVGAAAAAGAGRTGGKRVGGDSGAKGGVKFAQEMGGEEEVQEEEEEEDEDDEEGADMYEQDDEEDASEADEDGMDVEFEDEDEEEEEDEDEEEME